MLIEELLSLARADSGRENLRLIHFDLNAAVAEIGEGWRPLVESRNLRFTKTLVDRSLPVFADHTAVQRLLAILLDNAVKYTPAPGAVELRLNSRDNKAILAVRDTGIGIAEEDQARIFERFYRVDKARSREQSGCGIGLAIADWIVKQHSGTIVVQSALGKGSTFLVELPLQPASPGLDLSQDELVESPSTAAAD